MAVFSMLRPILAAVAFLLFVALVSYASGMGSDQLSAESGARPGTQPDTPSEALSEAPPAPAALPEACRECGLPYFRPSATPSKALVPPEQAASEDQSKATLGAPASIDSESTSGRAHLSFDPRVNTARVLINRSRFAEAMEILKPLAAADHPDQTDVRFLLGLAASRGSQDRWAHGRGTRGAPGRGHRGLPVHPDPPSPDWCACAWNWAWPSISEGR